MKHNHKIEKHNHKEHKNVNGFANQFRPTLGGASIQETL